MIPNNRWFPTSLQQQAAWFQNFTNQFGQLSVQLGFLPAQLTALQADNDVLQFCASSLVEVDAYRKAVGQYRKLITEKDAATPTATFPNNPTLSPPGVVGNGIFERLDNLVKRIRLSPAYNNEIGALLGILPAVPGGLAPENARPSLKVASMPGSLIEVSFVRGSTDGVMIEIKIDNAAAWEDAGKFFKSPAELAIPQNVNNLPRSVQVRARFLDGNNTIGQLSPVVSTATQSEG